MPQTAVGARPYGRGVKPGVGWTAVLVAIVVAAPAAAHIERTSYWPDPGPDTSVEPAAGGEVPRARSLASALDRAAPGHTRVVCKPNSRRRALHSIAAATKEGFRLRPSAPVRRLSPGAAAKHRRLTMRLLDRCRFRHIQKAVFASSNNDRIVVMPGLYLEGPSRAHPENDPRCADLRETTELAAGAASYRYQVACPNDQSLIYVQGRAVPAAPPPDPPLENRFGIPDEGACVRCNLQIEGAGVTPDDVVLDGAKDPSGPVDARAVASKDVLIRADRADGFVISNMTTAHASETGIYIHETDGYLIDNFKAFYNGLYGTLTFATDHGLTTDCDLVGARDSGVYPGGSPDTGAQRIEPQPRINQVVKRCDLHHNAAGYSGVMGNAVRLVNNDIYDNASGIVIASVFPGGHPGYPQDSAVFERNRIYSNNFDAFAPDTDVRGVIPAPVGTGIVIIGGNENVFAGNWIYDNWRRGAMQVALPDVFVGDTGTLYGSTSHGNSYHDNVMGVAPDGTRAPNGLDFWWDEAPGQRRNCWFDNGAVTTDPPSLPSTCDGVSLGLTYEIHLIELLSCIGGLAGDYDPSKCSWFAQPSPPSGAMTSTVSGAPAADRADPGGWGEHRRPFENSDTLQFASCAHWLELDARGRQRALARIEQLIAGQSGQGTTLGRATGEAALDGGCSRPASRAILLYEIYDRAVAFAPLLEARVSPAD